MTIPVYPEEFNYNSKFRLLVCIFICSGAGLLILLSLPIIIEDYKKRNE